MLYIMAVGRCWYRVSKIALGTDGRSNISMLRWFNVVRSRANPGVGLTRWLRLGCGSESLSSMLGLVDCCTITGPMLVLVW